MASNDKFCNLLDSCGTPEAPLCPLQEITLKKGIWYGDEPICGSKLFQNLGWIKKQRYIAGLRLKAKDGFFTVKMLNALRVVPRDIKGADPDSSNPEKEWLKEWEGPTKVPVRKRRKKTAKRRSNKVIKSELHKRLF